jgi:hypothetical protein
MKVRSKEELATLQSIKAHPNLQAAIPRQIEGRVVQIKPICLIMAYISGLIDWR